MSWLAAQLEAVLKAFRTLLPEKPPGAAMRQPYTKDELEYKRAT
jgi:hypothetical protein